MKALLVFVFALLCFISHIHGIPADFESRVEDLVNTFMRSNNNPGLGLAVVTANGSFTFARGYGYQDLEQQIPMTSSNLFSVASISKSFAATLASRLLNEKFPGMGESALDAPIADLAPALNVTFIDRFRAEGMSFRDILSHHTCLSTNTLGRTMGAYSGWDEFVYRTRYVPSICPYRTGYHYNNNMFGLAGELVGRISGDSYANVLSNFLRELGMNNSRVLNATENYDTLENFPNAYFLNEDGELTRFNPALIRRAYLTLGSSGVVTTPEDFTRYLLFRLNNGRLDGKQIVPEKVMNWVKTPANPFNFKGFRTNSKEVDGDYAYALGLNTGFYEGYELISHDGYWPPFASRMSFYPSLGFGMFSSTNGPGRLSTSMTSLHNSIAAVLIGEKTFDEINGELVQANKPFESEEPVPLRACQNCIKVEGPEAAGKFGNPFHGELEIIYNSTDPVSPLRLEYGIWGKAHLLNTSSSNQLRVQWETDVIHDYYAASGSVPTHTVEFLDANTLVLNYDDRLEFVRNMTLSTLPEIPWGSSGCKL